MRPRADGHFQLIAGERRWRAARIAGLREIPAIVEAFDDEAALEIAIIENLQREDISPLEEAEMFERMTTQHGYSLRKLAQKLGKDKGYIENRLRLADAPAEVRELVATRSDTLSAAYELMKVSDPRTRRRLAAQVATGELSLAKLRQRIQGRAPVPAPVDVLDETERRQRGGGAGGPGRGRRAGDGRHRRGAGARGHRRGAGRPGRGRAATRGGTGTRGGATSLGSGRHRPGSAAARASRRRAGGRPAGRWVTGGGVVR